MHVQYWVYVAYDVGDLFYDDPQAERERQCVCEREREERERRERERERACNI